MTSPPGNYEQHAIWLLSGDEPSIRDPKVHNFCWIQAAVSYCQFLGNQVECCLFLFSQLLAPQAKRHLVDDARNLPDSCATENQASFGHVLILSLANRRHRGCDA